MVNPMERVLDELANGKKFETEELRRAWVKAMDQDRRGASNRTTKGDRVQLSQRCIDWHISHLTWCYGRKAPENDGYSEGEKEIGADSAHEVFFWAHAKLSGRPLIGHVMWYGMYDESKKTQKPTKRKCVWVNFHIQTDIGARTYGTYVSELDLKIVGRRK